MPTPDSKTVKFWPVPRKGIWRHVPVYEIPDDALYDSNNVVEDDGNLVPRPGLTVYDTTVLSGTPVGATMYYQASNTPVVVAATTTKVYSFDGGTWTNRTGTPLTGTASNRARFTTQVLGNTSPTSYVIITNGVDNPQKWDGVAATTSSVAGSPPKWTDVTTISDRIVGILPPYNVSWSPVRNIGSWPALNYHQAAFTPDEVVAIRNFGVQGGVLYKRRSIWTVSPTGLDSDAKAYRFDMYGLYDGPASPSALVQADGIHVYMTATGRVGVFDGSKHQWVGEGIWPLLRGSSPDTEVDLQYAARIFGVYDPLKRTVYFYYPQGTATGGRTNGIVMVTLPTNGRPDFGCFLGATGDNVRGVYTGLTFTDQYGGYTPLVFVDPVNAANDYKLYSLAGVLDIDSDIGGHWQTGLFKLPDSMRLEGVEVYGSRGDFSPPTGHLNHGILTVEPVSSWVLADDGKLGQAQGIGFTTTDEPRRDPIGFDTRARFAGLRFSFTSADFLSAGTSLKFKGVSLLGQKVTI